MEIRVQGDLYLLLSRYASDLKEILNVSKVTVIDDVSNTVIALPASGTKCARCWNFMPVVGPYGIWDNVCTRCQSALKEMGIAPPQAGESAE